MCFGYLLDSPQWSESIKYPDHIFYEEIRINKPFLTYHCAAFKDSLQQQINFNGNMFGIKCHRCKEDPL